MSNRFDARCAALVRGAAREGCSAALITTDENVHYLSGFTGEDSWLLISGKRRVIMTDSRFVEEAALSAPGWEVHCRKGPMAPEVCGVLRKWGGRVAFESADLSVDVHKALSALRRGKFTLVPTTGLVEELRVRKDPDEVRKIVHAVKVAEEGLKTALAEGARCESEADFAARLEYSMRRAGAEREAFPSIVAGEPLSSLPHAKPSKARICDSSTLLVDWGASCARYNSDLTRVVAAGRVTPRISRIWKAVKAAHKAAIAKIRPGVLAASVDGAARRVISDAGYGEFFGHGLGHGVGLAVHEGPSVSPGSRIRLKSGMILTVEPGIYLPGTGGVRLEDMVLVTPKGARVLTGIRRSPAALGALWRGEA